LSAEECDLPADASSAPHRRQAVEQAEAEVRDYIRLLDEQHSVFDKSINPVPVVGADFKRLDREIRVRSRFMKDLAKVFDPTLIGGFGSRKVLVGWPNSSRLSAAEQLLAVIDSKIRVGETFGWMPDLVRDRLHPVVSSAVEEVWRDGHLREAVQRASSAVFDELLVRKYGRADIRDGKDRVTQAFTTERATPETPRLRFTRLPHGSAPWRSLHEGVMHFGQGCSQAIRNVTTHNLERPAEELALDCLASLSLLARWIDEAEVVDDEPELPKQAR
jgi:hypothetical protein